MLLEDAKLDCEYHPQLHRAPYIPPSFPSSPAHFFSVMCILFFCCFVFIFHNFIYFLWAKAVASLRASFVSQPFQKVSILLHRHHKSVCYFQPSSSRVEFVDYFFNAEKRCRPSIPGRCGEIGAQQFNSAQTVDAISLVVLIANIYFRHTYTSCVSVIISFFKQRKSFRQNSHICI